MKKHINELQNEESKYYDAVNVWFDGGERESKREHYAFETTAVRANKEGEKYIEITDLYRGIYTFGKEKTIHYYHFSRSELSRIKYYELIEYEDDED